MATPQTQPTPPMDLRMAAYLREQALQQQAIANEQVVRPPVEVVAPTPAAEQQAVPQPEQNPVPVPPETRPVSPVTEPTSQPEHESRAAADHVAKVTAEGLPEGVLPVIPSIEAPSFNPEALPDILEARADKVNPANPETVANLEQTVADMQEQASAAQNHIIN